MSIHISRRAFVKCVAAASMSAALSGLLTGCGQTEEHPGEGGNGSGNNGSDGGNGDTGGDTTPSTYTVFAAFDSVPTPEQYVSIPEAVVGPQDETVTLDFVPLAGVSMLFSDDVNNCTEVVENFILQAKDITCASFALFVHDGTLYHNTLTLPVFLPSGQTPATLETIRYKAFPVSVETLKNTSIGRINQVIIALRRTLAVPELFASDFSSIVLPKIMSAICSHLDSSLPNFCLSTALEQIKEENLTVQAGELYSYWPTEDTLVPYGEALAEDVIRNLIPTATQTITFQCRKESIL